MISTLLAALALLATTAATPDAGVAVHASIPLTLAADGFAGRLELCEDHRITAAMDSLEWDAAAFENCEDADSLLAPLCRDLAREPIRTALILIRDANGRVVYAHPLRSPLARIRAITPYGDARRVFLVGEDLSTGVGGGTGPVTSVMEMRGGVLAPVVAHHAGATRGEPIVFVEALRADWRVLPAGGGRSEFRSWWSEFGSARRKCGEDFATTYARYIATGHAWTLTERVECGFREVDEEFPPAAKFTGARRGR